MSGDLCVYLGFVNISFCLPSSVLPLLLPRSPSPAPIGPLLPFSMWASVPVKCSLLPLLHGSLVLSVRRVQMYRRYKLGKLLVPLSVGSRAKRDCGTATWGLGRLMFPNDSPLWYNRGGRMTPLTERQHKYSHWCLHHEVCNLQKQAYSRFFTPTSWVLFFSFSSACVHGWMNACVCVRFLSVLL